MSLPISSITIPSFIQPILKPATAPGNSSSFQNALSSAIQQVENSGATADAAAQSFLSGGNGELHTTILAAQSADIDFELFMQARNKVVSAYEEIMRMQI